jgi:NitT/TauT family transport system substrate-binding protein
MSLAGAAGLLRAPLGLAAEGPLETTTVRILKPALCASALYVTEQLLRAEGFTDIRYVDRPDFEDHGPLARGECDFGPFYASQGVQVIDAGQRITLLAGAMVGCYELFANNSVRTVADLKGKTVGIQAWGSTPHALVTLLAAEVGLDPARDLRWVTDPEVKPIDRFTDGRIDAFLAFPPEPQQLRAARVGHVLVNTAMDRPWSQYFCCMLAGSPDYVRAHPNATKRVVRAILTATDLCATEPARAAQQLADRGLAVRYDYVFQTLSENGYKWREYDAEDTIRFYALRMRDVGLIKSTPQKIIADGTNWRFLDELKRELKA